MEILFARGGDDGLYAVLADKGKFQVVVGRTDAETTGNVVSAMIGNHGFAQADAESAVAAAMARFEAQNGAALAAAEAQVAALTKRLDDLEKLAAAPTQPA